MPTPSQSQPQSPAQMKTTHHESYDPAREEYDENFNRAGIAMLQAAGPSEYVAVTDLGGELGRYRFNSPVSAWNAAASEHGARVGAIIPAKKFDSHAQLTADLATMTGFNEDARTALRAEQKLRDILTAENAALREGLKRIEYLTSIGSFAGGPMKLVEHINETARALLSDKPALPAQPDPVKAQLVKALEESRSIMAQIEYRSCHEKEATTPALLADLGEAIQEARAALAQATGKSS